VKALFRDLKFKKTYSLGAINSINFARIMFQITYYFYTYFKLFPKCDGEMSFSVGLLMPVVILLYLSSHTATYMSSYYCMCPHTSYYYYTSSYCYIYVLILLYVSSYYCMCPHTTICVLILLYLSSYYFVSSYYYYTRVLILLYMSTYYYICVLILLYMCPHTAICVLTLLYGVLIPVLCVLILLYMFPQRDILLCIHMY